jgi:hypothetical protein
MAPVPASRLTTAKTARRPRGRPRALRPGDPFFLARIVAADRARLAKRPRTRGECASGPRPCPWLACKWHLYLDVNPETGAIELNFPGVAPDELDHLEETCALDIADRGEHTLEEIGAALHVSTERARNIETRALERLRLRGQATLGPFHSDSDGQDG